MNKIFFLLIILISILAFDSYAQESLNEINKYNEGVINSLSIIIALIGGIVSILSPCAWPLIPAFLGFSLDERKGLINSAALFFIGLLIPVTVLNFGAVFVGKVLIENKFNFVFVSGIVLIILGLLTFFDYGFGLKIKSKIGRNWKLILIGAAFSVGFTPCVFPITSGIAFVSASLNSYIYAGLLSIAYVTGQAMIVFLGAIFFDKFKILEKKVFLKNVKLFGKQFLLVKIISGLILILFGLMFVFYGGSVLFNLFDPLNTMPLVTYGQEFLINLRINSVLGNVIGIIILGFIGWLIYKLIKNN